LFSACGGVIGAPEGVPAPDSERIPRLGVLPGDGLAPDGVVPGEQPGKDGINPVSGDAVFRVDSLPGQHVAFELRFGGGTGVTLAVDRWDGGEPVRIGITDAGPGLRVLAVVDQESPRTFWVTVAGDNLSAAQLGVTRTPFEDKKTCQSDCARLLQLPLPNDPALDGYSVSGSIFRYQFGRRDLVMFIRYTGRTLEAAGMNPFQVADLSQWDAETPGTDTGNLRHASHERGKDVDISLYGSDGKAPFRSYCTTTNDGSGRECVNGTLKDFDGYANVRLLAAHYQSGRVTRCFLDTELIEAVIPASKQAATDGAVAASLVPLYADGVHLQHWPNHDNHVHIRVSEAPDGAPAALVPFQAP
jgi:hypothetical protein